MQIPSHCLAETVANLRGKPCSNTTIAISLRPRERWGTFGDGCIWTVLGLPQLRAPSEALVRNILIL